MGLDSAPLVHVIGMGGFPAGRYCGYDVQILDDVILFSDIHFVFSVSCSQPTRLCWARRSDAGPVCF